MKYDIHIQPVQADKVQGSKCMEFGFTAAAASTGFQSLIDRWLKILLTPAGSCPLHASMGTSFMEATSSIVSTNEGEVRALCTQAIQEANTQVTNQDINSSREETELLDEANIVYLVIDNDRIDLWVEISNMAGELLTVPIAQAQE